MNHQLLANPPTFNGYADISRKLTRLINQNSADTDSRTSAPTTPPNPQQHHHHRPKHAASPNLQPPAFTRPNLHPTIPIPQTRRITQIRKNILANHVSLFYT